MERTKSAPEFKDEAVKQVIVRGHSVVDVAKRLGIPEGGLCRVLKVHRSGFYAWLHEPQSARAKVNEALTAKIREFYDQSMGIYGSPRIFCDLREAGIVCSEHKVARLMRAAGIKSVRGYKRPRYRTGKPALVAPNQLQRQFEHHQPDHAWVTDITYIRTHEG